MKEKKIKKLNEQKKKEEEIMKLCPKKKASLKHILEVSNKMYEEAQKRQIKIRQKSKNKKYLVQKKIQLKTDFNEKKEEGKLKNDFLDQFLINNINNYKRDKNKSVNNIFHSNYFKKENNLKKRNNLRIQNLKYNKSGMIKSKTKKGLNCSESKKEINFSKIHNRRKIDYNNELYHENKIKLNNKSVLTEGEKMILEFFNRQLI